MPDMPLSKDEPYHYIQEDYDLNLLEGDLARALTYWNSLTGKGQVPTWSEFNLMELPPRLISHTHIFDVLDNGNDFLCRFWGTALTEIVGMEMTGKRVSEIHSSQRFIDTVFREMKITTDLRAPRATNSYLKSKSGLMKFQILLRLPLANESGDVGHCMTLTDFRSQKDQIKNVFRNIK